MFKPRKAVLVLAAAALIGTRAAGGSIVLPPDGFAPGWTKADKPRHFQRTDLFNYIDGGAELFLEFGFKELTAQIYANSFLELDLEVYEMESPESALGIYLLKSGRETPVKGLSGRTTGDRFQVTLLRNRWFVHVNNPDGLPDAVPAMTTLARKLLAALPEGPRVSLLDNLPPHNMIKGSERLFRGPYGLQSLYTLGQGDILKLGGKIFGLAADYKTDRGEGFTRLMIAYPDAAAARDAFDFLQKNLDSYLSVVDSFADVFSFKDFKDKYGQAELKGTWVEILVDLPAKPIL